MYLSRLHLTHRVITWPEEESDLIRPHHKSREGRKHCYLMIWLLINGYAQMKCASHLYFSKLQCIFDLSKAFDYIYISPVFTKIDKKLGANPIGA